MAGGLNRNITVRLLADTSKFTAGMAKVSAEAEKTSTTMEASGGKTKLLTAGIAATALGVAAVRMAADFDAGMSTVQANTGASADEMSLLRQAAIDAGADTVYSATDAADAINELGKAGMSTSDILSGGLNGALDLAASDGMEVAEAAELMSSAMAQFNLTGADATRIADALAAGAGKAQGSARDLGYALQQSGMVANSFGIGMEETVGTLNLDLPAATAGAIGGVKPDGKTITAAADGTITAVAQTGPVEYRELVGYENAAQGYAVRVSDRTWLCCFNSFAMQTDGTTRLPYFYAFLRQAGSSSLTALVANPFDTNGITLLSTDGEQMRFSYGGGGRWAGASAVSGLDAATLILTEA